MQLPITGIQEISRCLWLATLHNATKTHCNYRPLTLFRAQIYSKYTEQKLLNLFHQNIIITVSSEGALAFVWWCFSLCEKIDVWHEIRTECMRVGSLTDCTAFITCTDVYVKLIWISLVSLIWLTVMEQML